MLRYAPPLQRLIEELEKLPGIGPKSAQRLAFHLLRRDEADLEALGTAILRVKREIRLCAECFNYSTEALCPLCSDSTRDRSTICVVEQQSDVMALERAGEYRGLYHVLGGALSPIDGIGHSDLRIDELLARIERLGVDEVILATSPTVEGDATAEYLRGLIMAHDGPKVSRIALGLPVGGDLDYADQVTIARAMRGRTRMEE
jgi:recombination protein RecR